MVANEEEDNNLVCKDWRIEVLEGAFEWILEKLQQIQATFAVFTLSGNNIRIEAARHLPEI